MQPISDQQLISLLQPLAEAARADSKTAERFVTPPRTGILEEVAAGRHQFVFGRRGVGKSTLLRKVQSLGSENDSDVIFIDIETLRGRPYPDVLIELLIELLVALGKQLEPAPWQGLRRLQRRGALNALRALIATMKQLLIEPQVAELRFRQMRTNSTSKEASGKGGSAGAVPVGPVVLGGKVSVEATTGSEEVQENERSAEFTQSKMDGLLAAAVVVRSTLADAVRHLGETKTLIVLDDFNHVKYDDQPDVLSYLHQIVKNLPIYLKVCGVRHRILPFVEGDPPRGMELPHDAGAVSLDITLERFEAAQDFLEKVLAGVCTPVGVDLDDLLTDGGRQRLVLGSGGVARDYLYLTLSALRIANERPASPSRPRNRISAEDVNEAAATLSEQKQADLARDSGANVDKLRNRLSSVVRFCLDINKNNIFLVEGTKLIEEEWGREIQALTDLRLLHQFGNLSVQAGTYRGRRFFGFTLDLSAYTGTRTERIRQIEFWTPAGKRQARGAGLVYTPDAVVSDPPEGEGGEDNEDEELEGEWTQGSIFDTLPIAD